MSVTEVLLWVGCAVYLTLLLGASVATLILTVRHTIRVEAERIGADCGRRIKL